MTKLGLIILLSLAACQAQEEPQDTAVEALREKRPAWYEAVSNCGVGKQPNTCGDLLTFKDSPPACREYAKLYIAGKVATVAAGYASS